ncbi:hypothetical protein CISIN_1g042210mg, partial [Citrus sinensis]
MHQLKQIHSQTIKLGLLTKPHCPKQTRYLLL